MRFDILLSSINGDWDVAALKAFCAEFVVDSIVEDQGSDTMKISEENEVF